MPCLEGKEVYSSREDATCMVFSSSCMWVSMWLFVAVRVRACMWLRVQDALRGMYKDCLDALLQEVRDAHGDLGHHAPCTVL